MPDIQSFISRLGVRASAERNVTVQIMSDLHLEVGQQYQTFDFPVTGKWLVLAGDIGRLIDYEGYRTFLEHQVQRFEKVALVLGNHEFFDLTYEEGISRAEQLASEPSLKENMLLLNRNVWRDESSGVIIMGCTLWSSVPDSAREIVEHKISDYKKIDGWSVDKNNQQHTEDAAWLTSELQNLSVASNANAEQRGRNILVVTHHAPSLEGTSAPEHVNNPWTPAFATELLPRLSTEKVKTWVFGHTHYTTELRCLGVQLIANQRGYVFPGNKPRAVATDARKWPWTSKTETNKFDPKRTVRM